MTRTKPPNGKNGNGNGKRNGKKGLTPKQALFVKEYIIDFNASRAARAAGYSERTAGVQGFDLLKNPKIQDRVRKEIENRSRRTGITADMVVTELARIALSDMRKFAKWGPDGVRIKDSIELTDDDAACVAEVSETSSPSGGSTKFKLYDKKGALELLGKHLGLFTDKVELTGAHGGPIQHSHKPDLSKLTEEELNDLEKLLSRATPGSNAG